MNQKDLSGRLARWSLKLQGYDFNIEYRKGSQNVVPDALSRMFMEELETDTVPPEVDLASEAFKGEQYSSLIENFTQEPSKFPDVCISEGYIYVRTQFDHGNALLQDQNWKLWVPDSLTDEIIKKAHEPANCAHGGIGKTLKRLRQKYYWVGMAKQVKETIGRCHICKSTKATNQILRPPMGEQMVTERPFQRLYIDYLGPYPRSKDGNTVIFLAIDHLSKYVFIKPLRDGQSHRIISYMEENIFHTFGVPEFIHSDNGKQFVSKQFEGMVKRYGIQHIKTAFYSPQANSSERVNRSLLAAVRAYVSPKQNDWDQKVNQIACAFRSSVHEAVKTDPYFILFGTHMVTHGSTYELLRKLGNMVEGDLRMVSHQDRMSLIRDQIQVHLKQAHEKGKKYYDLRARKVSFKPGQEVYRRNFQQSNKANRYNSKLADKFVLCRIDDRVGNNLYKVSNLQGKHIGLYHAKDLKL